MTNPYESIEERLARIEKILLNLTNQPLLTESSESTEDLVLIQEASRILRLAVPTIYCKVSRSELPCMKRGKRLYFSKKELLQYLKGGRRKTKTEIESETIDYLLKK